MSREPLFVGVDVGTSGVRVLAIDAARATVAQGSAKLADFGMDNRDPVLWRAAMDAAFTSMLSHVMADRILAVAVDGTSGTMLAVDGDGAPVAAPLMYNDPVDDDAILDAISAHAPFTSAAHGATSALARAIRLRRTPGAVRLVHQADWIAGLFSERFDVSDENNALKTGYDPVARRWPDWMTRTGADVDRLPRVVEPGTPVGPASGPAGRRFGLRPDALVVAGTTDGCASFLATGASEPGDAVTALGTTLTLKMLSETPLFAPEFGLYSHRIGDRWLAGGASNTGGNVIAAFFDGDTVRALSETIDPETETGLNYYPLLKPGERFPISDPAYPPRMTPRPDDDAQFLKAILEGIAAVEAVGYRRLADLGAPDLRSMRTVGGGAGNAAWTAMRRRRLGVPFEPVLSEEAAMGTALLALAGARKAGWA
ncbi:MAG: FGGY-family carbohydrate kinase [Inquilinaceae bacterium]